MQLMNWRYVACYNERILITYFKVNAMVFNSVYFSSSELAYSKTARGTKTAMQ